MREEAVLTGCYLWVTVESDEPDVCSQTQRTLHLDSVSYKSCGLSQWSNLSLLCPQLKMLFLRGFLAVGTMYRKHRSECMVSGRSL